MLEKLAGVCIGAVLVMVVVVPVVSAMPFQSRTERLEYVFLVMVTLILALGCGWVGVYSDSVCAFFLMDYKCVCVRAFV